jgi:putative DNA primase/helicase
MFIREHCEIGAAYSIGVGELFDAWRTWCAGQGRDKPGTVQGFGRDLRAGLPGLKLIHEREGDDRTRCYEGVKLKCPA